MLNAVGADGVGVKLPIFPVNCSCLPFSQENDGKNEGNDEKQEAKKNDKKKQMEET